MASNSGLPLVMIFLFVGLMSAVSAGVGSYTCTGGTWDYSKFDGELCLVWPDDDTSSNVGPGTPPPSDAFTATPPSALKCNDMTTVSSCIDLDGCTWDDSLSACRLQRTDDVFGGCSIYSSEVTCPADCEWNAALSSCDELDCSKATNNTTCQRTPALFDKCMWDTNDYVCRDRKGCELLLNSEACNGSSDCEWSFNACRYKIPQENKPCADQVTVDENKMCYNSGDRSIGMGWSFFENATARECANKINQYRITMKSSIDDNQTQQEWTVPGTALSVGVSGIPEEFYGASMTMIADAYDLAGNLVFPRGTLLKTLDDTNASENCGEVGIDLSPHDTLSFMSGSAPAPAPDPKDCVVNDNMYTWGQCERNGIILDGGGSGDDAAKRCGFGVRKGTLDQDAEGFEAATDGGTCTFSKFHPDLCEVACPTAVKPEYCSWLPQGFIKVSDNCYKNANTDQLTSGQTCANASEAPSAVQLYKNHSTGTAIPVSETLDGTTVAIDTCPNEAYEYKSCPRCPVNCEGGWQDTGSSYVVTCATKQEATYQKQTWTKTKNAEHGGSCPDEGKVRYVRTETCARKPCSGIACGAYSQRECSEEFTAHDECPATSTAYVAGV